MVVGKREVVAPLVGTVLVVVGVFKVKTMARGIQKRRAQRSDIGVGDSMMFSGQHSAAKWWRWAEARGGEWKLGVGGTGKGLIDESKIES